MVGIYSTITLKCTLICYLSICCSSGVMEFAILVLVSNDLHMHKGFTGNNTCTFGTMLLALH